MNWTCPTCGKEFTEKDHSFETTSGDYICQGCMERLEAYAESIMEDR